MGRWTVGVRGRLHDEFGMHAKKIDSNRQHNSSPNTGDNLFPPCPNHERDINAPPPQNHYSMRLLPVPTDRTFVVYNHHGWPCPK